MTRWTWSLRDSDLHFDVGGRLALDSTVRTQMTTALTQHLAAWWANPAHGERLEALMAGTPPPDLAAELEDAVREALVPLERAQRIRDLQVQVELEGNRVCIRASAHDTQGDVPVTVEVTQ